MHPQGLAKPQHFVLSGLLGVGKPGLGKAFGMNQSFLLSDMCFSQLKTEERRNQNQVFHFSLKKIRIYTYENLEFYLL